MSFKLRTSRARTDESRARRHRRPLRAAALVLPAGLALMTTACFDEDGSGDLATVHIEDFVDPEVTGVSVLADVNVNVRVDPSLPQSAQLVIDDNLIDRGVAYVSDGTLTIDVDGWGDVNPSETPTLDLTVKRLDTIENHGSGAVVVAGLAGGSVDVVNDDDGTITASGAVDFVDVESTSDGTVDLAQLLARRVELSDTDDGSIEVHATDVIEGSISGNADVVVHGNPSSTDVALDGSGLLVVA